MSLTDERFDEIMEAAFPALEHHQGTMDEALSRVLPGLSEDMRLRLFEWALAAVHTEGTADNNVRMLLAFIMGARIGALVERAEADA